MATGSVSPKKGKVVDIPSTTVSIGTATDGGNGVSASVPFTPTTYSVGGPQVKYTATSNPGSFTADATASPITVSGLTAGTAYTFTVAAGNPTGYNAPSAASNSVTIYNPPAYDSIATVTVGSGGVASVTFSSISQSYTHLELRWYYRMKDYSAVASQAYIYFNGVRNGLYSLHSLSGNGSTTSASANSGLSETYIQLGTGPTATANAFGVGVTTFFDYTNTNKNKTMRGLGGYDNNGSGTVISNSGLIPITAALTTFVITPQDGNFAEYSKFALYGIKGA